MHILLLSPPAEEPPQQSSSLWLMSALESLGHKVSAASVGEHIAPLIAQIKRTQPDLVLLNQDVTPHLEVPGFYPALCEHLHIPVVGAQSAAWTLAQDPETARALAGLSPEPLPGNEVTLYFLERHGICGLMPLTQGLREAALNLAKVFGLRDIGALTFRVDALGEIDLGKVTPHALAWGGVGGVQGCEPGLWP